MGFVRVGWLSRLQPGGLLEYRTGDRQVAVCNVDGEIHALNGICPHAGAPLGQGALHGRMLVCPFHSWEFDCTTGECDFNPRIRLDRYEVRVEGDEILVNL
jgi:nitrite reductase/ring-hydroxylating ferredoxin subunit